MPTLTFDMPLPTTTQVLIELAQAARACASATRDPLRRLGFRAVERVAIEHAARWAVDHPAEAPTGRAS